MTKQSIMLQRECFNRADFFVGPSRHDVARSHRVNTALLLCCSIISLRYRKLLKVLAKKTAGGRRPSKPSFPIHYRTSRAELRCLRLGGPHFRRLSYLGGSGVL
jgi:hypothetical protein